MEPSELVDALRDGRVEIAPMAVSVFGSRLARYVECSFSYLSALEKETVCEAAVEKAIDKIHLYDIERGSFDAWLRAFVRFEVLDLLRSPHREFTFATDEARDEAIGWARPGLSDLQSPGVADDVRAALESLPETDRLIITMRVFERVEFAVIAEQLGVTAAACRQRHHRALTRLAHRLTDSQSVQDALRGATMQEHVQ